MNQGVGECPYISHTDLVPIKERVRPTVKLPCKEQQKRVVHRTESEGTGNQKTSRHCKKQESFLSIPCYTRFRMPTAMAYPPTLSNIFSLYYHTGM